MRLWKIPVRKHGARLAPRTVVYCDPPYLFNVRRHRRFAPGAGSITRLPLGAGLLSKASGATSPSLPSCTITDGSGPTSASGNASSAKNPDGWPGSAQCRSWRKLLSSPQSTSGGRRK